MKDIIETTTGIRCDMCGVVNWPTAMSCMRCTATLDKRTQPAALSSPLSGERTFSQSLARFFEVVDYILLAPACYGMLALAVIAGSAPFMATGIVVWFVAGCLLLRGFFRHSRGRLSDSGVSTLWLATIGYNLVDLIITVVIASNSDKGFYYFALWPLLVIILSATALSTERQRLTTS